MLALEKQLGNIIQKIQKELEVIMILNMYILSIQRGIEECQQVFHQLTDVYLHSQDDILQPQILIIARITELLQQQKVPEVLVFPILSTLEILTLIKPVIVYSKSMYVIRNSRSIFSVCYKKPLLQDNMCVLYKSLSFSQN